MATIPATTFYWQQVNEGNAPAADGWTLDEDGVFSPTAGLRYLVKAFGQSEASVIINDTTLVMSAISARNVVEDDTDTFTPAISAGTNPVFSISGPAWATIDASTGEVTLSPPLGSLGDVETITVFASNTCGTVSRAFDATVTAAPVAPSVVTAAVTTEVDNGATITYTFTPPVVEGNPTPTISRVLTLDGVDVTADLVGNVYTATKLGVTQLLRMTYVASNGITPNVTRIVNRTVSAAAGSNVAPSVATNGGVVEEDLGATYRYTFTPATFTGTAPITVVPVLTVGGVDRTTDMVGNVYTATKTGSTQALAIEWRATNAAGGPVASTPITRTIPAASAENVAPSVNAAASVSAMDGGATITYTFTPATFNGTPTPTVTRVLTLGGVDVTGAMSGNVYTATKTGSTQALQMTYTGSNGASPNATSEVSATVPATSSAPGASMATSVTNPNAAITFSFLASSPVIQYADDVWAVEGATVTGATPDAQLASGNFSNAGAYENKLINGCMSSAIALGNQGGPGTANTLVFQAWDGRVGGSATEYAFDNALQATFPRSGTQILAKAKSNLSANSNGRDNLDDLALLYMVPSLPPAGSFRMWNPADAPVFNITDLDPSVIPLVALPVGATMPTFAEVMAKLGPLNLFMRNNLFMRGLNPENQQSQYGGDIANDVGQALHFISCSANSEANRLKVLNHLVASGILIAYACESGCRWSSATFSNGGGQQWLKVMVVLAARVLRNAANATALAVVRKWADAAQSRVFADDITINPITRTNIETKGEFGDTGKMEPLGYYDFMENSIEWSSKPSGDDGSFQMEAFYRSANAPQYMSFVLFCRMIGAESLWGNPKFFEYVDCYYNVWKARNKVLNADTYTRPINLAFVDAYYETYAPTFAATGDAPARVRLVVRDSNLWIECDEPLDAQFIPNVSAFTVTKNGSPVTLSANSTTGGGTKFTSNPDVNFQFPVITVASATGAAIGKRVATSFLPADTLVTSVSGTTIGISSLVPATFAAQPITFEPVSIYRRSCAIILPDPAVQGDVFTLAYTAPGSNDLRNLRGVTLPSFSALAVTNETGALPAPAPARELAYSGPTQATRQYLAAPMPKSETIRRLQVSVRFLMRSKTQNDTIIANSNGSNFRFYLASISAFRINLPTISGVSASFRMPNSATNVPNDTEITAHFMLDFTATSYANMYRGIFRWNGGEHVPDITASAGAFDTQFDIATIFGTTSFGMTFGAIGNGNNAFDGSIGALAIRWGDGTLSQPADFSGAQWAYDADWGGNAQNLHGVAPQRFYSITVAEANSAVINRGSRGAAAMTPRRLDAGGEDLLTLYTP